MDKIKVFGLYLGCEIEITSAKGTIGTLAAINANHNTITVNQDENSGWVATVDECQLILTPLEQISDEDAIWIGRMLVEKDGEPSEALRPYIIYLGKGFVSLNLDDKIPFDSIKPTNKGYDTKQARGYIADVSTKKMALIIDYLRSRYYNLPYMGMGLVESGIAVLKTK